MEAPAKVVENALRQARSARLATSDKNGQPHIVPVCFAYDNTHLYTPIDRKPKHPDWTRLTRVRNIQGNQRVALLVDKYSEQWSELWYVQVRGEATLLAEPGDLRRQHALLLLREKYVQYRSALLPEGA